MSILSDEMEDRYPIDGTEDVTISREQLALQLRRAYKAGATRDYTRTPQGVAEFNKVCGALFDSRLLPEDADFEAIVSVVLNARVKAVTSNDTVKA